MYVINIYFLSLIIFLCFIDIWLVIDSARDVMSEEFFIVAVTATVQLLNVLKNIISKHYFIFFFFTRLFAIAFPLELK
ncbi:hypothetical protein DERF_001668 [Dermatophagoides farinae]|uniref:Uncharacterized protein n=1 Tax=Dermatophagoides farinae TaxID=6954 RepID=A0A922IC94_DERFA|nr:hypothetical protein DERF_001668 [Dermatophagoides farinae]